jgi:tyrosinase
MATGAPNRREPALPLRHRPRIDELTDSELAELRAAFLAMMQISDERGYQYFAGIHGLPLPAWCDRHGHGTPTFLHWHRAYLYRFELALRATGHDVMVPWWDWISNPAIPTAYADAKVNGSENPLFSARINQVALDQGRRGLGDDRAKVLSDKADMFRQPGQPGTAIPSSQEMKEISGYSDFATFTFKLEDAHGAVHVWVGGHMTDIPFAAYDPIFWSHHAMIDRLWRKWQIDHSDGLPATLLNVVMQPFDLTARETEDVTTLGYEYALSTTTVAVP